MINVFTDSRYAVLGNALHDIDTDEVYWPTRQPIALPPDVTDRYLQIRQGERLEAFAYRVWKSDFNERATRLWWIIADLNKIVNPFTPITPGRKLRIISATRVLLEVFNAQ